MSEGYERIRFRLLRSGDMCQEWPVVTAYANEGDIIIPDQPALPLPHDEDGSSEESHNCDAMGCGTEHVMMRLVLVEEVSHV